MNSILEQVYRVCSTVQEEIPEITTLKNLIARTRNTFKLYNFDIDLKSKKDKSLDNDKWYVMAYYDSDNDAHNETPIEVLVYHNLDSTEHFGPRQIKLFLLEIFDAVVHEFRHQHQSMRRNFKEYGAHTPSPYYQYLQDQDEQDAYAFSIAIELLRVMDRSRAQRNLSRISKMSKMRTGTVYVSSTLRAYIEYFGISTITKKLAKKIYQHLETIDKRYIFV